MSASVHFLLYLFTKRLISIQNISALCKMVSFECLLHSILHKIINFYGLWALVLFFFQNQAIIKFSCMIYILHVKKMRLKSSVEI